MFTLLIPQEKIPIKLKKYSKLEDKFNMIYGFSKIDTVFYQIDNLQDYALPQPLQLLHVSEMLVPGGTPAYIKSKLTECFSILKTEIKNYLQGEDDFESISECFEHCIQKCKQACLENDRADQFSFNEKIEFYIYHNEQWQKELFQNFQFSQQIEINFQEHFDIRKSFYQHLGEEFTEALKWHLERPESTKKPYQWVSENAELEISEMLFVLQTLMQRIKIDESAGATFSKFRRDFFQLFGLLDNKYSKKLYQIRERKFNDSFINEMAASLQNYHDNLGIIHKK